MTIVINSFIFINGLEDMNSIIIYELIVWSITIGVWMFGTYKVCKDKSQSLTAKIMWCMLILLFNIIGVLFYYIGRKWTRKA